MPTDYNSKFQCVVLTEATGGFHLYISFHVLLLQSCWLLCSCCSLFSAGWHSIMKVNLAHIFCVFVALFTLFLCFCIQLWFALSQHSASTCVIFLECLRLYSLLVYLCHLLYCLMKNNLLFTKGMKLQRILIRSRLISLWSYRRWETSLMCCSVSVFIIIIIIIRHAPSVRSSACCQ